MRVVLRKARNVVVQRVERGARKQAALTHAAAKHFSQATRAFDCFCWATQGASSGTTQAFGKTHADGVGVLREVEWLVLASHARVPQARAVHMHNQSVGAGLRADGFESVNAPECSAATVVRVLHHQHARARSVNGVGSARASDIGGREHSAIAMQGLNHATRQRGGRASFIMNNVAVMMRDNFVATFALRLDGQLISHGSAGREDRGFFSKHARHALL